MNVPHRTTRHNKKTRRRRRLTRDEKINAAAAWLGTTPPAQHEHRKRGRLRLVAMMAERVPRATLDDIDLAAAMVMDGELPKADAFGFLRSTARQRRHAQRRRRKQPDKALAAIVQRLRAHAPRTPSHDLHRLARRIISGAMSEGAAIVMIERRGQGGNVTTYAQAGGAE